MLKGNLTCENINKLLTHYVEDNLDKKCKEMVSVHLRNCPICMEKYSVVKKLFMEAEKKRKLIKERENMHEEISAYLDGEMEENELLKFEEKLSKNKDYEETLLNITKVRKILNNSFYKMQYNLQIDLSKKVMEKFKNSGLKNWIAKFFGGFLNKN